MTLHYITWYELELLVPVEANSARQDGPFTGGMFEAELQEERAFRTRIDVMELRVAGIPQMCCVIDMAPTGPGNSCIMTMYIRSRRKGQRMVRGRLREIEELRRDLNGIAACQIQASARPSALHDTHTLR
jgi:hypothetical protein